MKIKQIAHQVIILPKLCQYILEPYDSDPSKLLAEVLLARGKEEGNGEEGNRKKGEGEGEKKTMILFLQNLYDFL